MKIDRSAVLTLATPAIPGGLLQAQSLVEAGQELIEHADLAARNAAIIRRHHDALNSGDIRAAVQFFAEDTQNHGVPVGRKACYAC